MSEKLPYEEIVQQQLTDLPLPDENLAWDEMRKLLEEDDDDEAIIPPIRRGCAGWMLLIGLILTGIIWFYFKPFKKNREKSSIQQTVTDTITAERQQKDSATVTFNERSLRKDSITNKKDTNVSVNENITPTDEPTDSLTLKQTISKRPNNSEINSSIENSNKKQKEEKGKYKNAAGVFVAKPNGRSVTTEPPTIVSPTITNKTSDVPVNNSTTLEPITNLPTDSTAKEKDSANIVQKPIDSTLVQNNNPDSAKAKQKPEKTYSWGAGLALHQQIPFAGQTAVPYNSMGRTGGLADYIPSVFFRFYQDRHWFIESEFRYGAPQYTEEIVYDVKKHSLAQIDTLSKLKKTYYHQLPLSFNYYLFPGFSVGTGIVWNRFSSAVSEKEVVAISSSGSIDSTLSTEIVKVSTNDSVFSKSYWTWQLQTQYTWKRLMLGVRYSKGLQPYIKFTLPGGQSQQQSSQSLQIFLRYELWRKKK